MESWSATLGGGHDILRITEEEVLPCGNKFFKYMGFFIWSTGLMFRVPSAPCRNNYGGECSPAVEFPPDGETSRWGPSSGEGSALKCHPKLLI